MAVNRASKAAEVSSIGGDAAAADAAGGEPAEKPSIPAPARLRRPMTTPPLFLLPKPPSFSPPLPCVAPRWYLAPGLLVGYSSTQQFVQSRFER